MLAVVPALVAPMPAHAVLYTVHFTVLGDPTDPNGAMQTADGEFTFDYDNLTLQDVGNGIFRASQPDMETSLSFPWQRPWTEQDVDVTSLDFDMTGALLGASLSGYTSAFPDGSVGYDFYLNLATPNSNSEFGYFRIDPVIIIVLGSGSTTATDGTTYAGSVVDWSYTGPASVPEPGTLSLLGLGLLPMGLVLRRRTRS